jgi:hypothetical protein
MEAADQFTAGITAIADLFPPAKLYHDSVLVEPRPTVVVLADSMVTEVRYNEAAPTHQSRALHSSSIATWVHYGRPLTKDVAKHFSALIA